MCRGYSSCLRRSMNSSNPCSQFLIASDMLELPSSNCIDAPTTDNWSYMVPNPPCGSNVSLRALRSAVLPGCCSMRSAENRLVLCQVEQATLAEAERDPEPNKALQPAKKPVSPLGSRFAQVIPEIMRTVAAQRVPTGMPEIVCLPGQVGRGFSENSESFF